MIKGTKLLVATTNICVVFRQLFELIHDLSLRSRFNLLMQTAKLETNFTVLNIIVLDQVNIELSIGIGFLCSQANVADTNL